MAGDGEGATALFEVKDHRCGIQRRCGYLLSKSVLTSSLTKAAILDMTQTGDESSVQWVIPAWNFDPEKVDLFFESAAGKNDDYQKMVLP